MGASRRHSSRQTKRAATRAGQLQTASGPTASANAGPADMAAPPRQPTTVAQCMDGGWKEFGFADYGACLVFVLTRPPGPSRNHNGG